MRQHFLLVLAASFLSPLTSKQLPTDVVPTEYQVTLIIDSTNTGPNYLVAKLEGNVCIKMVYNGKANKIELLAKKKYGLSYDDIAIVLKTKDNQIVIAKEEISYSKNGDTLLITTPKLKSGNDYELCIGYKGIIKEEYGYYIWSSKRQESSEQSDESISKKNSKPPKRNSKNNSRKVNDNWYMIATNSLTQIAFPTIDVFNDVDIRLDLKVDCRSNNEVYTFSNNLAESKTKWSSKDEYCTHKYVMDNADVSSISFAVTNLKYYTITNVLSKECAVDLMVTSEKNIGQPIETYAKTLYTPLSYNLHPTYLGNVRFLIVPGGKENISWTPGLTLMSDEEAIYPNFFKREYAVLSRLYTNVLAGIVRPNSLESLLFLRALITFSVDNQKDPERRMDENKIMEKQRYVIPKIMTKPSVSISGFSIDYETDVVQGVLMDNNKALMIFSTVNNFLSSRHSKATFRGAVRKFISNNGMKRVGPSHFGESMDSIQTTRDFAPRDCDWACVFRSWTSKEGYPLVTVTVLEGGKFKVTQEPFFGNYGKKLLKQKNGVNEKELCWPIALPYTKLNLNTERESEYWTWITCDKTQETEKEFETETKNPVKSIIGDLMSKQDPQPAKASKWKSAGGDQSKTKPKKEDIYIFNMGYLSLLRVKYDESTWEKIHKAHVSGDLIYKRKIIRAQWIHDAFTLAWSGYQDYEYAFRTIKIARTATDITTWNAFFASVHGLNEILKTSPTTHGLFENFISTVLAEQYKSKYQNIKIFDELKKIKRNSAIPKNNDFDLMHFWSCTVARISLCTSSATEVFDVWSYNLESFVDAFLYADRFSDLVYTVLCTFMAKLDHSKKEDYAEIVDFLEYLWRANSNTWNKEYVGVLRCVRDVEILVGRDSQMPFRYILREEVNFNDPEGKRKLKIECLLILAQGSFTFPKAFDFFCEHTDILLKKFKDNEDKLKEVIRTLAYRSNSEELEKMHSAMKDLQVYNDNPSYEKAFQEGKEAKEVREEWMKKNEENIVRLIRDYNTLPP